jgi:ubiquinone/menaquinone biosynthesis C-methylase UbiE
MASMMKQKRRLLLLINLLVPSKCIGLLVHEDPCSSIAAKDRRLILTSISASVVTLIPLTPSHALSPEDASKAYDTYATTYDDLDGGSASDILGINEARTALFGQARGSVLEIGCGTGLNLARYDLSKVTGLTLLDVSDGMLREAQKRAASMDTLKSIPIRLVKADATCELVNRFGKESFDTVVDSFSFCVMGTQGAMDCLNQMRQVVKPRRDGGQILLLENTRSSNPFLGLYQDATADAAASLGGKGCVYNQDVSKIIKETGGVEVVEENLYAAGIFRGYKCQVI